MKFDPCPCASNSSILKNLAAQPAAKMAVSAADSLECIICNEILLDPRPLPCGHSYCGPPRLCLATLKNEDGGLRCAVCCIDHNLKVDEIKPLYGIRDFFRGSSNFDTEEFSRLPCTAHPNKDFTLWCSTCSVMVCDDCIECEHDDHSIRKLKKYIAMKFEREVGKPLHEGIAEYKKCFGDRIESALSELERCKLEVQSMETKLQSLVHRKELLDQYSTVSKQSSVNLPAKETSTFQTGRPGYQIPGNPLLSQKMLNRIYKIPLSANVRIMYDFKELIELQISFLLSKFRGLVAVVEPPNAGWKKELICIKGTIPITFNAASFNIPISLWLPHDYPDEAPEVFVMLTSSMEIKANESVDACGYVKLPILSNWDGFTHSLEDVVLALIQSFSCNPPVFQKKSL